MAAAAIVVGGLLALGCSDEPEQAVTVAPGSAETASPSGPIQGPGDGGTAARPGLRPARRPDGTYVGVVVARQAVEVSAQEEGRLASVNVRVGDTVRRGDTLAILEGQQLSQDAAMALATLRAAQAEERRAAAQLQKAREQYSRRKELNDILSAEEIEASRTEEQVAAATLETARARVSQEQARHQQLQSRMARLALRSPIDGRVALRYFDAGALVVPGTPVVRLISSEGYLLRFAVPPEQAGKLQVGRGVAVRLDSPDLTLRGNISHVAPQVDQASQMVFVEAELQVPPTERRLQDGLAGRVSLLPG